MADAVRRRGARRVLRPDRRLRRPGRRAGRGLPGGRAGARRGRGRRRRGGRRTPARSRGHRGRRRRRGRRGRRPTSPTGVGGPPDRVTMRLAAAELVESREILPGQWLQAYHAPAIATGSRAGQFVHVRTGDFSGLVLRRPFSINTADAATGIITIHFRVIGRGTEWFTRLRPGDEVDMLGPLGRPFEVDSRSRHLLLDRRRPRHGRGPDARRRGDPRRPPGHAAVRRGELARGLPVEPAARRGRVRRRDRRRLARPPRAS